MGKLDDVERQLIEAVHASQYRAPIAKLVSVIRDLQRQIDALAVALDALIAHGDEVPGTSEVFETEDTGTPVLVPRKRAVARRAAAE